MVEKKLESEGGRQQKTVYLRMTVLGGINHMKMDDIRVTLKYETKIRHYQKIEIIWP